MNPAERTSRLDRIAAPLLCALVAGVFADVLFLGQRLFVRDVASYYYATKKIVRDTILAGEFPLWNRLYAAGQPMAANPEYAVFYPPHAMLLLPGYDFWFQVLVVTHVAFGAVGMYKLARSIELSGLTALYGAIAFAFGGLTASLLNLLPYLFILAWMPWAFMNARRWLLEGNRRALAFAAIAYGMQILTAEPTTLVQIWMMTGVWMLYVASGSGRDAFVRLSGRLVAMFVLSVGIGAVQLVPAIDHVGDSVRALRFPWKAVVSWSTPPWRLVELLIPSFFGRPWFAGEGGYWGSIFYAPRPLPFLFSIYCGFPVVVLALAGFARGGRAARWVAASCAAALVLAMGSATPLFRLLYDLGPAQSFRYPEKFLIAMLVLLLLFALVTLERIGGERRLVSRVGVGLAAAGLVVSVAAIVLLSGERGFSLASGVGGATTASGALGTRDALRLDWIANVIRFATFLVLFALLGRGIALRKWVAALVVVGFVDLAAGYRALSPSIDASFFAPPPVAGTLAANRDEWRVFPLANWYQSSGQSPEGGKFSRSGEGTYWTVRNGMSPMLLSAWGFRQVLEIDYDRTALLPTTRLNEALWDIRNEIGDARDRTLMAMGSARYVTRFREHDAEMERAGSERAAVPVDHIEVPTNPFYWVPESIESVSGRTGFVSRMLASDPGPRAALVEGDSFDPAPCDVLGVEETANRARIRVRCDGRSLLVASVTPHKYWTARVGGEERTIRVVNLGYSGIELEAGLQDVELTYANPVVAVSAAVSAIALLVVAAIALGSWRSAG